MQYHLAGVLSAVLLFVGQAAPVPTTPARPQAPPPKTYNETADARQSIDNAVKAAATDGIRVLVNWGANDDEASAMFVKAQAARETTPALFLDEYRRVYVDVGHLDKNLDLAKSYGVTLAKDKLPALTILDDKGKVIANVSARDFATDDPPGFSPQLISAFLTKHQAPQPNDTVNFENAVKQAKRDGKVVFVWFSAPW